MSEPADEQPVINERATSKQERNSLIFSAVSVFLILLIASPCVCYFGAGLFQGVQILRTGQQTNPARQGRDRENFQRQGAGRGTYVRPERYNRTFDEKTPSSDPATSARDMPGSAPDLAD